MAGCTFGWIRRSADGLYEWMKRDKRKGDEQVHAGDGGKEKQRRGKYR